jgi:hypothetical protein
MTLTKQRLIHCREWGRRDYHAGLPPIIPAFLKDLQERRAYAAGYTADKPFIKARPMPTDYAPYHTMREFNEGVDDYMSGRFENPYTDSRDGVKAQAHDRGSEYAMRVVRWNENR